MSRLAAELNWTVPAPAEHCGTDKDIALEILQEALTDSNSVINNPDHPWYKEAVQALRRLQLQISNPSVLTVSELDLKRLNISLVKAHKIQDNIKFHQSAIGDRESNRKHFVGWYENGEPAFLWMTDTEANERIVEDKKDSRICPDCDADLDWCDCEEFDDDDW